MSWSDGGSSSGVVGRRVRTDSIGAELCSRAMQGAKPMPGVASEVFKAGSRPTDRGWYLLRHVRFFYFSLFSYIPFSLHSFPTTQCEVLFNVLMYFCVF